ncbi:stage II sporulation protein R [Falsibacillus albus]|uniref:Stage II sporulation protein R n=2 Tax=Falsibacillus albus TaxID=2478915 RepID=A0A3L7JTW5_9BACI|nr:stage II sporulation protein R [Falsibacillus albus]
MKRKSIAWMYIVILSVGTIISLYIPKQETAAQETMVIPNQAIRLRILANSDKPGDQDVKRKIRDSVNAEITKWVQDLTSLDDARTVIQSHLPEIEEIAKAEMKRQGMHQSVHVKFGKVDFPTKLYGQYLYPAGQYEAVLITLGKGEGANWWCVLYPPLCFLDFSHGVAVSEGFEDAHTAKAAENTTAADQNDGNGPEAASPAENQDQNDSRQVQEQDAPQRQLEDEHQSIAMNTEKSSNQTPVYAGDEKQEVKVKFFVVELFEKLF